MLQELGHRVNVDEIDDGKDKLGLPAWHSLSIGKQPAPLILDIILELLHAMITAAKGEKASPLALGVL